MATLEDFKNSFLLALGFTILMAIYIHMLIITMTIFANIHAGNRDYFEIYGYRFSLNRPFFPIPDLPEDDPSRLV